MKFKDLLYSKNDKVFICFMEEDIQQSAINLTGGMLSKEGLDLLKKKIITEISNLINKIGSSKPGQIKEAMKAKEKVKKIRLSPIDKKVINVSIQERKRIGERKARRYQINYMR